MIIFHSCYSCGQRRGPGCACVAEKRPPSRRLPLRMRLPAFFQRGGKFAGAKPIQWNTFSGRLNILWSECNEWHQISQRGSLTQRNIKNLSVEDGEGANNQKAPFLPGSNYKGGFWSFAWGWWIGGRDEDCFTIFFFFSRMVRLGARGFSDQASHQHQQLGPGEGGAKMRGTRASLRFTSIKKRCIFQDLYFFCCCRCIFHLEVGLKMHVRGSLLQSEQMNVSNPSQTTTGSQHLATFSFDFCRHVSKFKEEIGPEEKMRTCLHFFQVS